MHPRIAVALLAFGGMSGAAQAGITVNATIDGQSLPACANAENVGFTTATTLADMRFSYLCPSDGVVHTCTPAAAEAPAPAGTPFFAYDPAALSVTIVCTNGMASGLEVYGSKDSSPITGCNPAINVTFSSSLPLETCVAGSQTGRTEACVQFQCPGDTAPQGCFPIIDSRYDVAGRRIEVTCETLVPMLRDSFDFD